MNLLEQVRLRIGGLKTPNGDGTYADGWEDCRSAILKALYDAPTASQQLLVRIGISDIPSPMSSVKKGDFYRIYDIHGAQIDAHVRQALADAETVDGVTTIKHKQVT